MKDQSKALHVVDVNEGPFTEKRTQSAMVIVLRVVLWGMISLNAIRFILAANANQEIIMLIFATCLVGLAVLHKD